MMRLFRNSGLRLENVRFDNLVLQLNRAPMPQQITEGKYTGYRASSLRDYYLFFSAITTLTRHEMSQVIMDPALQPSVRNLLWLSIIVCKDEELIKELRENILAPTGHTWIRYSPFDPEVSDNLYELIDWAGIELVIFNFQPGVDHAWTRLGENPLYQQYLEACSNSLSSNR